MSEHRQLRLALLTALAAAAAAQSYVPGPQVLTFFSEVDDTDQPYGLYLPKGFDPARKYPLVISLHGASSNHRLNLRRVFGKGNLPGETDAEATRRFPPLKDVDFLVASPLARGTVGYQGLAQRDVYDVLADVKRRFPIDEDRVYLTGLSMGGGGTLWLGLTRPDVWAALAPVCPAAPPGTEQLAGNALNLPVRLFHGAIDPVVPVEVSRRWHRQLADLETKVEYVEYPGIRHNSWDLAYQNGAIFDWFAKFARQRFPQRVRFASWSYKHNAAYWVNLDGLTPGRLATIDARLLGINRVEVHTSALDGFTLRLDGHPNYRASLPLAITIDGTAIKMKPRSPLSFVRTAKGWTPGAHTPAPGAKRPGAEGPISEAVSDRHYYVYGTADAPPPEELARRRSQAALAADWSGPRNKLLVSFRVLADKELKDSDLEDASLVLFGTKETNSVIARFASALPLSLNAGAADYGLLFVYPAGRRYLVVNSGLPFWTGAEHADRPGWRFMPQIPKLLASFGDYILFKGSLEDVVAEGRFDSHWRLPIETARKMLATGAVEVKK